jgi:hypothetical protein
MSVQMQYQDLKKKGGRGGHRLCFGQFFQVSLGIFIHEQLGFKSHNAPVDLSLKILLSEKFHICKLPKTWGKNI